MTDDDFRSWALDRGMDATSIDDLIRYAPRPGQLKGPPLYTLEKIRTLNETGGNKSIQSDRFVIVFNFRSGDRVALDVSVDKGAVYYIGDTQEHDSAGQLPAVKAFPSIRQLVDASFSDDEVFPESYMEALGRLK